MGLHKEIMSLVIGYTLVGAVVFTVVTTCLSLIGWVTFTVPSQQNKLFYILIVEIVVIAVGHFKGWLEVNPTKSQKKIISIIDAEKNRLWELTSKISPVLGKLTESTKADLEKELTYWYYKGGGGMYLSLKSTDLFLKAKDTLSDKQVNDKDIFNIFSALRTQLKVDLGIYSPEEAKIQIGPDKNT